MTHRAVTALFGLGLWLLTASGGFAQNADYIRLQNRWKPEQFLNIEHGRLESGPIQPGWFSAMWLLEDADAGFVRLRNRWKPDEFIHVEYGTVASGAIQPGWYSAMWGIRR